MGRRGWDVIAVGAALVAGWFTLGALWRVYGLFEVDASGTMQF